MYMYIKVRDKLEIFNEVFNERGADRTNIPLAFV